MTIIFKRRNPERSFLDLKTKNKTFLIRESRQIGMITVDTLLPEADGVLPEGKSYRFALVKDKWIIVSDEKIKSISKKIAQVSLKNIEGYQSSLFLAIKTKLGLDVADKKSLLCPTIKQQTSASAYSGYVLADKVSAFELPKLEKKIKEIFTCPLTLEEIKEPVIGPDGHIFEKEALFNWLDKNSIHPITGIPITKNEFFPTNSKRDFKRKIAKIKSNSLLPGFELRTTHTTEMIEPKCLTDGKDEVKETEQTSEKERTASLSAVSPPNMQVKKSKPKKKKLI